MRIGKFQHRITIQKRQTDSRDDDGYITHGDWVDHCHVFASFTPMSVKDVLASRAANHETTARCVIRHRTDIDSTMRVIHRGKTYSIDGDPLADNRSGLEYMTLMLSSGLEKHND